MQLGAFAIVVVLRRKDVIGDELKDLSGLYFRSPFAAVAMLLFMLSLGGIPPTAGFMGKFWLFSAAIESGYVWLAVIGVVNSAISLYYYVRVIVFMWIKEEALGSPVTMAPALVQALLRWQERAVEVVPMTTEYEHLLMRVPIADLPPEWRGESGTAVGSGDWTTALALQATQALQRGDERIMDTLTAQFERTLILQALHHTGGRRIEAATLLGIGRNTLTRKIQELGLENQGE